MKFGAIAFLLCVQAAAADRPGTVFKIFQFPADQIPRVDGNADDWKIVPADYSIGTGQLVDDTNKERKPDPKDLDVTVKVGWVQGLTVSTSSTRPATITGTSRAPDCTTTSSNWWWTATCRAVR
jgi:hypothetical protein